MRLHRWTISAAIVLATMAQSARLGLPPIDPPDPQLLRLGQTLFFSKAASVDGRVSCASCHDPAHAFSDGRPIAIGNHGQPGTRNSPGLTTSAFTSPLMWDGRRKSLRDQVFPPFTTSREHGLQSRAQVVQKFNQDPDVRKISPTPLTETVIGEALTAYIISLATGNSDFDRMFYGQVNYALTPEQIRGYKLFIKVGCSSCHTIDERYATFTDNRFHVSNKIAALSPEELKKRVSRVANTPIDDIDEAIVADSDLAMLGRYLVTKDPADVGAIKTPSLRDAARTAPYFHDGSMSTLDGAVRDELSYRDPDGPILLDDDEISSIVRFIESLNSQ